MLLLPQTSFVHWLAVVQPAPFAAVQVSGFGVVLQRPVAQTAAAFVGLHVALWSPSAGIAVPALSFEVQVKALRRQK